MRTIDEMMSLRGRRALITGAVGGIGSYMARALAELGADLMLVDRPGSDYEELIAEVQKHYDVKVESIDCNLENNNCLSDRFVEVDTHNSLCSLDALDSSETSDTLGKHNNLYNNYNQYYHNSLHNHNNLNCFDIGYICKCFQWIIKQKSRRYIYRQ